MIYTNEHITRLWELYLQDKATLAEVNELFDYLKDSSAEEQNYASAVIAENKLLLNNHSDTAVPDWFLQQILHKEFKEDLIPASKPAVHRIHFLKTIWFRYAAAIVIVLGTGAYFWNSTNNKRQQTLVSDSKRLQTDIAPGTNKAVLTIDNQQINLASDKTGISVSSNTVSCTDGKRLSNAGQLLMLTTPKGGQYQLVLPDGSKVWLNAASSIKFPAAFKGTDRHVEVRGEVYMEIAQNTKQPFLVNTKGAEIQVLGTSFNLNAYEDEDAIKTTLIEGSVKVIKDNKEAILKPGYQAVIASFDQQSKESRLVLEVQAANVDQTLAWKNGLFNFDGADLKSVMRQLERWYDIKVQYNDSFSNVIFRGKMYRNVSFSSVLKMLEEMGVKFELKGNILTVL